MYVLRLFHFATGCSDLQAHESVRMFVVFQGGQSDLQNAANSKVDFQAFFAECVRAILHQTRTDCQSCQKHLEVRKANLRIISSGPLQSKC